MDDPQHTLVLIRKAGGGDEQAFKRLLVMYHPRLRARLMRQMDATMKARIEPEDILQQVYLEAFKAIGQFNYLGKDSFLRWLFTILDRKLIDEHRALHAERRDVRRETKSVSGDNQRSGYIDLIGRLQAETGTPSRVLRSREAVGTLHTCLAALPEHYQEVIRLRFIHGLPVGEVAERMRRSVGSIHMICHRALAQLRRQFEQMGLSSDEA
ncbi:MAG: RNA polymerase sigma factor [Phycisphaerae bacterium]|nr:RNA polymerase sigma factor [Phycisphaerae bacterium]